MGFEIQDTESVAAAIKTLAANHVFGDTRIRVRNRPVLIQVEFLKDGRPVAGFTLIEQPNCCGALISTQTWVSERERGQGIAQAMMPLKDAIARKFGYSALVATVNETGNPAEVHILTKHGWRQGHAFLNQRTGNRVGFYFKSL